MIRGRPLLAPARARTARSRSSRRRRRPAWRTPPAARGGASANALRGRLRPCRGGDGSRQLAQQAGHLERDQRALLALVAVTAAGAAFGVLLRSEEHTSELQSLMRISYAVFCLKKKNK